MSCFDVVRGDLIFGEKNEKKVDSIFARSGCDSA